MLIINILKEGKEQLQEGYDRNRTPEENLPGGKDEWSQRKATPSWRSDGCGATARENTVLDGKKKRKKQPTQKELGPALVPA